MGPRSRSRSRDRREGGRRERSRSRERRHERRDERPRRRSRSRSRERRRSRDVAVRDDRRDDRRYRSRSRERYDDRRRDDRRDRCEVWPLACMWRGARVLVQAQAESPQALPAGPPGHPCLVCYPLLPAASRPSSLFLPRVARLFQAVIRLCLSLSLAHAGLCIAAAAGMSAAMAAGRETSGGETSGGAAAAAAQPVTVRVIAATSAHGRRSRQTAKTR